MLEGNTHDVCCQFSNCMLNHTTLTASVQLNARRFSAMYKTDSIHSEITRQTRLHVYIASWCTSCSYSMTHHQTNTTKAYIIKLTSHLHHVYITNTKSPQNWCTLSDSQVSFVTQTISKAVLSLFVSQSNINMKANTTAQSTSADQ